MSAENLQALRPSVAMAAALAPGIFLSAAVALSANFKAAGTVSYQDGPSSDDGELVAAGGLYYYPSSASEIGAELLYSDPQDGDSEFGAHLRFETHFN